MSIFGVREKIWEFFNNSESSLAGPKSIVPTPKTVGKTVAPNAKYVAKYQKYTPPPKTYKGNILDHNIIGPYTKVNDMKLYFGQPPTNVISSIRAVYPVTFEIEELIQEIQQQTSDPKTYRQGNIYSLGLGTGSKVTLWDANSVRQLPSGEWIAGKYVTQQPPLPTPTAGVVPIGYTWSLLDHKFTGTPNIVNPYNIEIYPNSPPFSMKLVYLTYLRIVLYGGGALNAFYFSGSPNDTVGVGGGYTLSLPEMLSQYLPNSFFLDYWDKLTITQEYPVPQNHP